MILRPVMLSLTLCAWRATIFTYFTATFMQSINWVIQCLRGAELLLVLLSRLIQWQLEQVHRLVWATMIRERLPITVENLDWARVLFVWDQWFLLILTYKWNIDRWYIGRFEVLFWIVRAKGLGMLNSASHTFFYDSIRAWFSFLIASAPVFSKHLLHLCFKVLSTKLCTRLCREFGSFGEHKWWLILGNLFAHRWLNFRFLLVEVL